MMLRELVVKQRADRMANTDAKKETGNFVFYL
jgi:hypothetical protein